MKTHLPHLLPGAPYKIPIRLENYQLQHFYVVLHGHVYVIVHKDGKFKGKADAWVPYCLATTQANLEVEITAGNIVHTAHAPYGFTHPKVCHLINDTFGPKNS